MECDAETGGSICLDACELHHLAPFLGFVGDEFPEFSGGHKCRLEAHVEEAHLHLRIGNDCVELVVEPVNNVGGRIFWGANTLPTARLVAGHKFVHAGMPGSTSKRAAVVTARPRSLPSLMYSID